MVDTQRAARTLRRLRTRHMESTVRVESVEEQFDDTTGENVTVVTATHYDGPATVGRAPQQLIEQDAADAQAGIFRYRVDIEPAYDGAATDVPRNARVTIDESPDATLAGRVVWVYDYQLGDHTTVLRLICREARP